MSSNEDDREIRECEVRGFVVSFEDILGIRKIHPAVDMSGSEAFIGVWRLGKMKKGKTSDYKDMFWLVSNDERVYLAEFPEKLSEHGLVLEHSPVKIALTGWTWDGVEMYLRGYNPRPEEVYNAVKFKIKEYVEFEDESEYDLLTLWIIGT